VKVKQLRVTIPFTGAAFSFDVSPSSARVPSTPVAVGQNVLTITVLDNDNADQQVTTFCDLVQATLDALRGESDRDRPQLARAVSDAAERRKREIAADKERDSKRSFSVRLKVPHVRRQFVGSRD
jgi:hypothetical protein